MNEEKSKPNEVEQETTTTEFKFERHVVRVKFNRRCSGVNGLKGFAVGSSDGGPLKPGVPIAHTLTDIGAKSSAQDARWGRRQQNSPGEPHPNGENAPMLRERRGMMRRRDDPDQQDWRKQADPR
jgi:hypothetical protein